MDNEIQLAQDLGSRANKSRASARNNYFMAYATLAIGTSSSAAATILAAGSGCPGLTAILAAIPGIIVLANNTFKFEPRAEWWYSMEHKTNALQRSLLYEGANAKDVSRMLSETIDEMEKSWPGFGTPPARHTPAKPSIDKHE